jgi:hypothetical protein
MPRASNLMIGTLTLALIAGSLGGWLGYRKYAGLQGETPFRVIFEGSASGVRKGSSVNFAGVRVGEVVSLKLDHHRVIAMTRIDSNTPIHRDTQVGLEFQGLTGIAAISFTGGSADAPPPPPGPDGIPELTADPEGTMGMQEKIRVIAITRWWSSFSDTTSPTRTPAKRRQGHHRQRSRDQGHAAELRVVHRVTFKQWRTHHRRRRLRRSRRRRGR